MNQIIFQEKYPIYTFELVKNETTCKNVDDILAHFRQKIEEHPITRFIALFDHYSHTAGLPESVINPAIKDAKNIIFCFGKDINDPGMLALRPRSIGVVELEKSFIITFLEAPNPMANSTMESWAKALKIAE
jgi:hypothetical protein